MKADAGIELRQTAAPPLSADAHPRVVLDGVGKDFNTADGGTLQVLGKIDLTIKDREFIAIVGPSGCGKSTVLRLISGLIPATRGRILVDGVTVTAPPPAVGFMFQRDTLLPWATVAENIAVGLELNDTPKPERGKRIAELLELLGLVKFRDFLPSSLSGGMRQRVALGRLLAYAPSIYLMDEPFGALDAMTKMAMGRELLRIWSLHDKSVVFVTHDVEEAVGLADRVIVMAAAPGRIVSEYAVDLPRPRDFREVRSRPEFRALCEKIWHDIGVE
jgi:NitT/TauT family transport system ATP-binding protein